MIKFAPTLIQWYLVFLYQPHIRWLHHILSISAEICHLGCVSLKLKPHLVRKEVAISNSAHSSCVEALTGVVSHQNSWDRAKMRSHRCQSLQAGSSFDMLGCVLKSSTASLLPTFLRQKIKKISPSSSSVQQPYWAPSGAYDSWPWPFLVLLFHFSGNVLVAICLLLLPHEEPDLYESSG